MKVKSSMLQERWEYEDIESQKVDQWPIIWVIKHKHWCKDPTDDDICLERAKLEETGGVA